LSFFIPIFIRIRTLILRLIFYDTFLAKTIKKVIMGGEEYYENIL